MTFEQFCVRSIFRKLIAMSSILDCHRLSRRLSEGFEKSGKRAIASLSTSKEQPIGVLLVGLVVGIRDRLDSDVLEYRMKRVDETRTFRVRPDRQDAVGSEMPLRRPQARFAVESVVRRA